MNDIKWAYLHQGVIVMKDGTPIHPTEPFMVEHEIGKYVNELVAKGYNKKDINIALDGGYVRIFDPISLRHTYTTPEWLLTRA